jgi:hypothetical protein
VRGTIDRLTGARGAGTRAEAEARDWVRSELSGMGLRTIDEPVIYDPWLFRVGLSILLPLMAAAVALALVAPGGGWAIVVVFALGLPVVSAVAWGRPRWDRGERVRSANLVAIRDAPRLWVVAHLDTKSQHLSFVARSVIAGIAVVALPAFAVSRLGGWSELAVGTGCAAMAALLVLAASGHGDRSPGANDNASGVALLLELARRLADEPAVGFVVSTGEEDGLVGADRFVRARVGEDSASRPFVVNLDTVGCPPLLITGHRLGFGPGGGEGTREGMLHGAMLTAAADVPHRRRAIPFPAAVDSFVFHRGGYPALTLAGGTVWNTYRYLHRPQDTADRLDLDWMDRVADVAERGIRSLVNGTAT